ncbi:multicopper oxidase domain-containing protein [Kitasatospora sp. NA04385]|uniref:multicopper oxidase family protein n=1 Tax=Kitasatospora sp. NA04385 TaxID=2742135 RepID=UPI001590B08F|nr:multicopper oxidase domain-containing protein [Kitasatospora sp. NA04385]QKW23393.1 multicopper oxidase domain-containing protein [Kitasatospora sp. NA04385]
MNRRAFLTLTALSGLAGTAGLLSGCGSGAGSGPDRRPAPPLGPSVPLRIPPLLHPEPDADGVRRYELTMLAGRSELLPGKPTDTWGFNGPFLGPTLRASRGDRVAVTVRNTLPEASTVHWHGMRLPAAMDGGPHQPIAPGGAWSPAWTVDQPAATTWYHPHPHGATARHVYRGLAGLFLLDDDHDAGLPAAYGVDDVPLILQDKKFTADGALDGDPLKGTFGILGDHVLVNGTHNPRFDVGTERVRLRVLNGSNARLYRLAFADRRRFHVVGTDGGLLAAPVETDLLPLSPGERAEVVVAFAPGEDVLLRTLDDGTDLAAGDLDLIRFVATARPAPSPALPAVLSAFTPIAVPAGAKVRRFTLNGHDAINGEPMDLSRIDEVVPAGAVEIWEVRNNVYSHNFHLHEAGFQLLGADGRPAPGYAGGPKDTVFVPGRSTVRLAVRFGTTTDPTTPYMYHCHILRHEDSGMMGQFVLVEPGTEDTVPRTLPGTAGHRH